MVKSRVFKLLTTELGILVRFSRETAQLVNTHSTLNVISQLLWCYED